MVSDSLISGVTKVYISKTSLSILLKLSLSSSFYSIASLIWVYFSAFIVGYNFISKSQVLSIFNLSDGGLFDPRLENHFSEGEETDIFIGRVSSDFIEIVDEFGQWTKGTS